MQKKYKDEEHPMSAHKEWNFMFPSWTEWVELKEGKGCQCQCSGCAEGDCGKCSCEECGCEGCKC